MIIKSNNSKEYRLPYLLFSTNNNIHNLSSSGISVLTFPSERIKGRKKRNQKPELSFLYFFLPFGEKRGKSTLESFE